MSNIDGIGLIDMDMVHRPKLVNEVTDYIMPNTIVHHLTVTELNELKDIHDNLIKENPTKNYLDLYNFIKRMDIYNG